MISVLRVYAINPREWITPLVTFVLFLVPVATNLVRRIDHDTPSVPTRYRCVVTHYLVFQHRNVIMVWRVLPPSYTCLITNDVPAREQNI